jgi:hypothetical protein
MLLSMRDHIIAAAVRHGFIPSDVCDANDAQLQKLYALAAVLYQEAHGDYLEWNEEKIFGMSSGYVQHVAAWFWVPVPGTGLPPSLGIGQIRPGTAVEIEREGLLHHPGTLDQPNPTPTLLAPEEIPGFAGSQIPGSEDGFSYINWQVVRLTDPLWAIEYTAANLERAEWKIGDVEYTAMGRPLSDLERMAAWHNRGYFRDGDPVVHYLNIIYAEHLGIMGTDLLGIESMCRDGCCDCNVFLPCILKLGE